MLAFASATPLISEEPVFDDALLPRVEASLDLHIDRLNMLTDADPSLPFPHSSQVEWESSKAIPESDKAIARPRWEDCHAG